MTRLEPFLRIHRYLSRNLFYPLVVSTALVFFFFGVRAYLSGGLTYSFLIKNLFLAWLPYFFALVANFLFTRRLRFWPGIGLFGGLWLLFLPNAPYIITDFLHLQPRSGVPLWYDVGFIMSIALTGFFLGIASLRAVHRIIHHLAGPVAGWGFALVAIALSGFGVYLGRFLRWNSWDVLNEPFGIVLDSLRIFRYPRGYAEELGFIFMIAALMLVGYWMTSPGRLIREELEG
ncbi:MAG TPA: DUF1361 domain-containing protein [Anaerolineales bacterium]|nr:DUF1361 domain-containing protein [Anaerolineales bacterium]